MKKKILKIVLIILLLPILGAYGMKLFNPFHLHNVFLKISDMPIQMDGHKAVLLNDGRVLIWGGSSQQAEIYNPKTRSFKLIGQPADVSGDFTMTLLKDGKVLLTGYNKKADLFNPKTNTFIPSGNLNYPRSYHTATLLQDGRVLIVGGQLIDPTKGSNNQVWKFAEYSEIYNPETQNFKMGPKLNTPRYKHGAVLLDDGNVLILGGGNNKERFSSAEIYDVKTNKFIKINSMKYIRVSPQVLKLTDGRVLITGGYGEWAPNKIRHEGESDWEVMIEIYNPETGKFNDFIKNTIIDPTSKVTLLKNDNVLFTAGSKNRKWYVIETKDSALLDINKRQFVKGPNLNVNRAGHSATLLKDGTVLITGGISSSFFESEHSEKSAELYIP